MTMDERFFSDDGFSAINESVFGVDIEEDNSDLDLTAFNDDEIKHIREVLIKDKELRAEERQRKKKIEESLDESIMTIEMRNVDSGDKFCIVCSNKFSLLNKRNQCAICDKGVCGDCVQKFYQNNVSVCKLCFLNSTRDGKTGRWFSSLSKSNGRFRRSATLVIMNSIRRIKASLVAGPERQSLQRPEPIKELSNGSIHHPMYLTKKNSPKPRKVVERDVEVIQRKVPPIARISTDITDHPIQTNINVVRDDSNHMPNGGESNLTAMGNLSASTMSVYSEAEESFKTGIPVSGDINIAIFYDEAKKTLNIDVKQCRNIAVADRKKRRTDPYVKSYLLPDKTKISKKKTSVKKTSVNPEFNETLSYFISQNDLASRTLSVAVWHKSSFLKYNIFLGEVQIVLSDMGLNNRKANWYPLNEKRKYPLRSAGLLFKGELILKIKYKAGARKEGKGALHVCVVGARKLDSDSHIVNSYVKGYLLPDKSSKSKKKTPVCKNSINPLWNSLLIFPDVTLSELKDRSLELSIYQPNRLNVNSFLGGVRLNLGLGLYNNDHVQWMDAQGAEKDAWEKFLSNPNEFSEAILNLRPNVDC